MGWEMPWYTMLDDFDKDFGVDEWHGTNAFIRDDDDRVFRTYFINARGDEAMGSTWNYLDITALGRQEKWEDSPEGYPQSAPYEWWSWHDEPSQGGHAPRCRAAEDRAGSRAPGRDAVIARAHRRCAGRGDAAAADDRAHALGRVAHHAPSTPSSARRPSRRLTPLPCPPRSSTPRTKAKCR